MPSHGYSHVYVSHTTPAVLGIVARLGFYPGARPLSKSLPGPGTGPAGEAHWRGPHFEWRNSSTWVSAQYSSSRLLAGSCISCNNVPLLLYYFPATDHGPTSSAAWLSPHDDEWQYIAGARRLYAANMPGRMSMGQERLLLLYSVVDNGTDGHFVGPLRADSKSEASRCQRWGC